MRESVSSMLESGAGKLALAMLFAASSLIPTASALNIESIPSPKLDLDRLGRVAFAGDFDSISLYQYKGQSEKPPALNGDDGALLSRFPNGAFATIDHGDTDGIIKAMCPFTRNGNYEEVIFGGNFTGVGGKRASGGIALLNTNNGTVTPLAGYNGTVNALYCDNGRAYVGGSFTGPGGNSSNAIVWDGNWVDMPFSGFNGPVHSIIKAPNGNIIFGGEFNGLGGNTTAPKQNNTQVLPIASANLSSQNTIGTPSLSDPKNIVCKSDPSSEGNNNTWLLADNTPGFWQAKFGFGFTPTKLRLHNTKFEGRGTKTWRYTALPDGGIMNLSYVDPTGNKRFCDRECPLPEGTTAAQDFQFVNNVGMNAFKIDISDWYGRGGGLNGIELFQNDIYTFAINEFNEPKCGGVRTGALSQVTPTDAWKSTPSGDSNSEYLTATLTGDNIDPKSVSVTFQPDIKQPGKYEVKLFTPGCRADGTCGTRGRINVSGSMSSTIQMKPIELYETNEFDKYDVIYNGFVDATDGFRPEVVVRPAAGQSGTITLVAQRVGFNLQNATASGLNGIYEYDPSKKELDTNFDNSFINKAGTSLLPEDQAIVTAVAAQGNRLFVGGNFSGDGFDNVFAFDKNAEKPTALAGNGLNNQVMTIYPTDSTTYFGGNFTNTKNNGNTRLRGVAAYSNNQWEPLGGGVEGIVMYIVPFTLNITGKQEAVLGISGFFNRVNEFDKNQAFSAQNFAVWVPSQKNWFNNLGVSGISMRGALTSFSDVPGSDRVYAGTLSSQALGASGAVSLRSGEPLSLESLPAVIRSQQQQASLTKRSLSDDQNLNTTGVITALFYHENNANKTILAGHFASTGTDGQNITNLLIIDDKSDNKVTGLGSEIDSNSTFAAVGIFNNVLYAGGSMTGRVNNNRVAGVLAFDIIENRLSGTQPPGLQGDNVTVNAITQRPNSKDVFVGGKFQSAGALTCPALCVWNTDRNQWVSPGGDLSGSVSTLIWISDTKLLIAGNLTSGNNATKIMTYDSSNSKFQEFTGARDLPGPVIALTPANSAGTEIWASGKTSDGSAYLQRFDGKTWLPVNDMFDAGTIIRSIQVLPLTGDGQHEESKIIDRRQDLLILGQINVKGFGSASGVLFDGKTMAPFLLSTTESNKPGSLSAVFVENPLAFFASNEKHMAVGFVVLISLAIALALTFLLVVAGILLEWYRKRSRGYMPAPSAYPDRPIDTTRLPPEQLFGTLQGGRAPAI